MASNGRTSDEKRETFALDNSPNTLDESSSGRSTEPIRGRRHTTAEVTHSGVGRPAQIERTPSAPNAQSVSFADQPRPFSGVDRGIHTVGTKNLFDHFRKARRLEKMEWISRRASRRSITSLDSGSPCHSQSTSNESTQLIPTASTEFQQPEVGEEEWTDALRDMILEKKINILLAFFPFAFLAYYLEWGPDAVFWFNFITMIPLASLLGDFTEELAAHTNQAIGGLINATFGNAVEVVVAIQALLANEIRVVQASMIGSIFSNLLLVLGCCFFFGGIKHKEQSFNSTAATANISLLALGSMALILPTPFAEYYDIEEERVLTISRVAALFLMFMYLQLMIFQIKTHAFLFADEGEEVAVVPFWVAMVGLLVVTVIIAIMSDFLVDSIDGFCESSGVSKTFIGLIILPIVGNAVEHITAVSVAMKNKMDLAMGVAIGSCVQISLFVIPLIVIIGWATNKNMTLNFPHFEIILFIMSVIIVSICLSNPKGNWLEGSLLMTTYFMIAVGFWYEKVVDF